MTKSQLVAQVAEKTGLDKQTVLEVFEKSLDTIRRTVSTGESCYFRGFGSFIPKKRAQKTARNIKANSQIIVPAHKTPVFVPGKRFVRDVKKLTA